MSSSTTEKNYIFSRVLFKETGNETEDGIMISMHLWNQSRCWYDHPTDYTSETIAAAHGEVFVAAHDEDAYRRMAPGFTLNDIQILLFKIYEEHSVAVGPLYTGRRGCLIVLIADLTVRLMGSFNDQDVIDNCVTSSPDVNFNLTLNVEAEGGLETFTVCDVDYHGAFSDAEYHDIAGTLAGTRRVRQFDEGLWAEIDRLTLQSFETRIIRFVPATKSSVEKLQKVHLDSLEESIVKLNPSCSICKDDFAEGGADQLVIHLPCTHFYHINCIMSWLEVSHVCPFCRYALPTVPTEVDGEPSNS